MAVTAEEIRRGGSRNIGPDNDREDVLFNVYADAGEQDEEIIQEAIQQFKPMVRAEKFFTGVQGVEPVSDTLLKIIARFEGRGAWQRDDNNNIPAGFEFDTTGQTQLITKPKKLVTSYGPKASANMNGVIGFDGKTVKGCEVPTPAFNFSITRRPIFITDFYLRMLAAMTPCVNIDWFYGWAPGEVLFLGARGGVRGAEAWNVTWNFSGSPNRSAELGNPITIPDLVDGEGVPLPIDKKGWDYLWTQDEEILDETKWVMTRKTIAAYVDEIFDYKAFTAFELY